MEGESTKPLQDHRLRSFPRREVAHCVLHGSALDFQRGYLFICKPGAVAIYEVAARDFRRG
jgi:hypothetical protein